MVSKKEKKKYTREERRIWKRRGGYRSYPVIHNKKKKSVSDYVTSTFAFSYLLDFKWEGLLVFHFADEKDDARQIGTIHSLLSLKT